MSVALPVKSPRGRPAVAVVAFLAVVTSIVVAPIPASARASAGVAAPALVGAAGAASLPVKPLGTSDPYFSAVAVSQRAHVAGARTLVLYRVNDPAVAMVAASWTGVAVLPVPGTCKAVPAAVRREVARLRPTRVVALSRGTGICRSQRTAVAKAAGRGPSVLTRKASTLTGISVAVSRLSWATGARPFEAYVVPASWRPAVLAAGTLRSGPVLVWPTELRSNSSAAVRKSHAADLKRIGAEASRVRPKRLVALGSLSKGSAKRFAAISSQAGSAAKRPAGMTSPYAAAAAIAGMQFPRATPSFYAVTPRGLVAGATAAVLTDGPVLPVSSCTSTASALVTRLKVSRPLSLTQVVAGTCAAVAGAAKSAAGPPAAGASSTAVVLTSGENQRVTSVNLGTGVIKVRAGADSLRGLSAGQVMVGAPAPGAPSGFIRRVTAASSAVDGSWVISSADADLTDVIAGSSPSGRIVVNAASARLATSTGAITPRLSAGGKTFTLSASLSGDAGTGAQVSIEGEVSLSVTPEIELNWTRTGSKVTSASIAAGGSTSLMFTGTISGSLSKDLELACATSLIGAAVGVIPVWVQIDSCLVVHVGVSADAVSAKVGASGRFKAGLSYATGDRVRPIFAANAGFDTPELGLAASGSLKLGIGPKISVKLYSVAGPYGRVLAFLEGGYTPGNPQPCSFSGGLEEEIGLETVFKKLGIDIPVSKAMTWKQLVSVPSPFKSGPCAGVFVPQPPTGAFDRPGGIQYPNPAGAAWSQPASLDPSLRVLPDGAVATGQCTTHNDSDAGVNYTWQLLNADGSLAWRRSAPAITGGQLGCYDIAADRQRNTYFAMNESDGIHVVSFAEDGSLRWESPLLPDGAAMSLYADAVLGADGLLYMPLFNSFGTGFLSAIRRSTGAVEFSVPSGPVMRLDARPEGGVAAVTYNGEVTYYDSYGQIDAAFQGDNSKIQFNAASYAAGGPGVLFAAGAAQDVACGVDTRVSAQKFTAQGVAWTWTDSQPLDCAHTFIAGTPDGGAVVVEWTGGAKASRVIGIAPNGSQRWIRTYAAGARGSELMRARPAVDISGTVVLPTEVAYTCASQPSLQCARLTVQFIDQATGSATGVPLTVDNEEYTSLTGGAPFGSSFAISANRVFVTVAGPLFSNDAYLTNTYSVSAFDAGGVKQDWHVAQLP